MEIDPLDFMMFYTLPESSLSTEPLKRAKIHPHAQTSRIHRATNRTRDRCRGRSGGMETPESSLGASGDSACSSTISS